MTSLKHALFVVYTIINYFGLPFKDDMLACGEQTIKQCEEIFVCVISFACFVFTG